MTGDNENQNIEGVEAADLLLKQLFHLKHYETPEVARMVRNKQNIMRQVREASREKRKSLGDLLEINYPWFFAEPKYGVAILFVAFAGLQYLGINARSAATSATGIYTSAGQVAFEQGAESESNAVAYAEIPRYGFRLFGDRQERGDVKFVDFESQK